MANLLTLDHLAISATDLGEGTAHAEAALGTHFAAGGAHPHMGTHNRLLSLGLHYLEVIAIDPEAPAPAHARWFNLDRFSGPPRLTNWICRTDDLEAALDALGPGYGVPVSLSRGPYRWRMAVPADGCLPYGGWAPALIAWEGAAHPVQALPGSGLSLSMLRLEHPQAEDIARDLAPLLPRDTILFQIAETPALIARIDGPEDTFRLC